MPKFKHINNFPRDKCLHIDTDKSARLLALGWLFTKKQFTTRNKMNYMDENEINSKAQISKFQR